MAGWIADREQFTKLCEHVRRAGIVAFDTEFVSESYYRPKLCLLQFAVEGEVSLVDPFAVEDLSEWWSLMADPEVTVVVHGGAKNCDSPSEKEVCGRRTSLTFKSSKDS